MNTKNDIVKLLKPLAEAMKAKKEVSESYILCLGEGATLSSGCREMRLAVRNTIAQECPEVLNEVLAALGRHERLSGNRNEFDQLLGTLGEDQWYLPLRRKFFQVLESRKGIDREQILGRFLCEDYPSTGYDFLALLTREGFFNVIFNANYDQLLEYALRDCLPHVDDQGKPSRPYEELINRADPSFKNEIEDALNSRTPRIKAIWLNGHWERRSGIAYTAKEKNDWYPNIKDVVEKYFGQDLLLLGYTDRDTTIRRALENATSQGTVWYVASEPLTYNIDDVLQARRHNIISGPAADFDTFCQVLFDLVLDLDDPMQVKKADIHRVNLLQEKQSILCDYITTLERRQNEDPTAPPTLQAQKEAIQREVKSIEKAFKNLR